MGAPGLTNLSEPGSQFSLHKVRDPKDQAFLDLALAAGVRVLVSGDSDLLFVENKVNPLLILSPADFRVWLDTQS